MMMAMTIIIITTITIIVIIIIIVIMIIVVVIIAITTIVMIIITSIIIFSGIVLAVSDEHKKPFAALEKQLLELRDAGGGRDVPSLTGPPPTEAPTAQLTNPVV